MINLLDLRPGRALKVSVAIASSLGNPAAGAVHGVAGVSAMADLNEEDMLGDCGANALGAFLGSLIVTTAPQKVRYLTFGALIGLTFASEKISFSQVIAQTPWLRAIDMWGRTAPVESASHGEQPS